MYKLKVKIFKMVLIDGMDSTKKPKPYFHCGPSVNGWGAKREIKISTYHF